MKITTYMDMVNNILSDEQRKLEHRAGEYFCTVDNVTHAKLQILFNDGNISNLKEFILMNIDRQFDNLMQKKFIETHGKSLAEEAFEGSGMSLDDAHGVIGIKLTKKNGSIVAELLNEDDLEDE